MLRPTALTGSVLLVLGVVAACDDEASSGNGPTIDAPGFDAGTGDSAGPIVNECPTPTGAGTTHGATATTETWTAAGSPHVIASGRLDIPAGVTVTLEPCAVVRLGSEVGMLVEGELVASGTATKPVTFEPLDAASPWTTIEVRGATGKLDLASTTLRGGGFPSTSRPETVGVLDIRGADQTLATQGVARVRDVSIEGSAATGVVLREGGGFTADSTNLSVKGSAAYPISTWARAVASIPSGGSLAGNTLDKVFVVGGGTIQDIHEDATFKNLGVPYLVGGARIGVEGTTTSPLLTIASGTTIQFAKNARLAVGSTSSKGALVVDGVTFTSGEATPAAGDWAGILVSGTDARNRITNATIEYAGGPTQVSSYGCASTLGGSNTGGVVILLEPTDTPPATSWVTNTTIRHSMKDGISRGWSGARTDFAATNTFTDVLGCRQTTPGPTCTTPCQ